MKVSNVKAAPVTAAQMSLLYDYYGSVHSACDTMHLSFEPLLSFLCDTLVYDPRLADILPDTVRAQATGAKAQMQEGLGQLLKGRTSFIIAHRLSTIRNADVIFYVNHGQIEESGNHEQLVAAGGKYAEMVKIKR